MSAWVGETNRQAVKRLKVNFPKLADSLQLDDESVWKGFSAGGSDGQTVDLPVQVSKAVTAFQRVLTFQVGWLVV